MRRFLASAILACSLVAMQGCSGSSLSIPNPFEPDPPSNVNEVYYGEFPSVPIPKDMTEVAKYTAVMQSPDGAKTGLQVFEGRIDRQSLVTAMVHNMNRQGWQLRSIFRAQRSILLFEKGDRNCIVAVTDSSNLATMEVWVASRLPDGSVGSESMYSTGSAGGSTQPTFSVAPGASSGGGSGVQEQGLSQ